MIENTNTKQFYPGPILNDTLEINEFLFNTAEQVKIKHSKLDENGVLRDVDLEYGYDYEVVKDEALTCEDDEMPSHAHIAEMALTASTGQIILKEHVTVLAGERLTAYRESAIIQDKNYPRTGAFPAAAHEGALDYLTMQNQEQQDELDRALKVPISTQNFAGSMPLPIPGRALKINQDGSGFEMSEFDPDIALTTTENFRNEAQQFASEAALSASSAKSSETIASQKVNEITVLHSNYTENITNLSEDYKQQIDTKSTNYLNQINSRGNTIIKDADAIINRVGLNLFDTVMKDHLLTYEESQGLALQGTWVYHDAIAGERYGYQDFYNKCVEEKNEATPAQVTLGSETVTIYTHANGHMFYDIGEKTKVDTFFATMGMAWYYGVDLDNKCIFLPRNLWFEQAANANAGAFTDAGIPNHKHYEFVSGSRGTSKDSKTEQQLNNSSQVSSLWYSGYAAYNMARNSDAANVGLSSNPTSQAVYGKSSTVQPKSVKKLLYICVGNQVRDTSWVDVVTQVAKGVKDIEDKRTQSLVNIETDRANAVAEIERDRKQALTDLTNKENAGLSALANASNALRTTQITNCIIEIPQRIKYTLENGTLIIKAGSAIIVPYGTEDLTSQYPVGSVFIHDNLRVYDTQFENGKFFVWAEIQTDIAVIVPATNRTGALVDIAITNSAAFPTVSFTSGETAPTAGRYYNTITNKCYDMSNIDGTISFPILSCNFTVDTGFTSVNQVFNGFGYIGSTIWVDKGVKGLIPNGRNEDGTLNNIEYVSSFCIYQKTGGNVSRPNYFFIGFHHTTDSHLTSYWQDRYNFEVDTFTDAQALVTAYPESSFSVYVRELNLIFENRSGVLYQRKVITKVCSVTFTDTYNVTSFSILRQTFRALDESNKRDILDWFTPNYAKKISLSSASNYTVPDYGWIVGKTFQTGTGESYATLNGLEIAREAADYMDFTLWVCPADVFKATGTIHSGLYFIPCKGVS